MQIITRLWNKSKVLCIITVIGILVIIGKICEYFDLDKFDDKAKASTGNKSAQQTKSGGTVEIKLNTGEEKIIPPENPPAHQSPSPDTQTFLETMERNEKTFNIDPSKITDESIDRAYKKYDTGIPWWRDPSFKLPEEEIQSWQQLEVRQLNDLPLSIFRLSDEERKRIYFEISCYRGKASIEIDKIYPSMPNDSTSQNRYVIDQAQKLTLHYIIRIAAKYNLTLEEAKAIEKEGLIRMWKFPISEDCQ